VEALFRYPVKAMGGETLESGALGWHGLAGDRRLALRRTEERGGFPWLTASKLPELILFSPVRRGEDASGELPTHVRTPDGRELPLFGPELAAEIARRHGAPVEMTHLDRGIFDAASVSLISTATVEAVGALSGHAPDTRRFRPNVLVATSAEPFREDAWVGGLLSFGEGEAAATLAITNWDVRCTMIGLDPDTARSDPGILKAVVRERNNLAGVYASVVRRGHVAVGQALYFTPALGQGRG